MQGNERGGANHVGEGALGGGVGRETRLVDETAGVGGGRVEFVGLASDGEFFEGDHVAGGGDGEVAPRSGPIWVVRSVRSADLIAAPAAEIQRGTWCGGPGVGVKRWWDGGGSVVE